MPRKDIDYSKSVIYKIVCNNLDINYVYVGSTTNFIKRKQQHKSDCNNSNGKKYNIKLYDIIRQNKGWDQFTMLIIEEYPCNLKHELLLRERFYFELLNSKLNSIKPIISNEEYKECQKEYRKEHYEQNKEQHIEKVKEYNEINKEQIKKQKKIYYENNKEQIKEQHKEHYESNKEQINEQNKRYTEKNKEKIKINKNEPYTCECGKTFQKASKSRHIKTNFHQTYIQNNPSTTN